MLRFLVLFLLLAVPTAAAESGAQTTATSFYGVYIKTHPPGVPSAKERAPFVPVVSVELNNLLIGAKKAEAAYAKKTKGKAPPLVEGDLFTSNFEGATSFTIGSCDESGQTANCTVDLVMAEDAGGQPAAPPAALKWQDKVFLIRTAQGWKVDDIAYGANWPFGNRGTLKEVLADVPRTANE